MASILSPDRYVRIGDTEYPVIWSKGWALWSKHPAPGFTKKSGAGFARPIEPGEPLECYALSHDGTYRGIPVRVAPSSRGRLMVTTKDDRARHEGFDPLDREEWVKILPDDDRELRFVTTRTPEPAPWRTDAR